MFRRLVSSWTWCCRYWWGIASDMCTVISARNCLYISEWWGLEITTLWPISHSNIHLHRLLSEIAAQLISIGPWTHWPFYQSLIINMYIYTCCVLMWSWWSVAVLPKYASTQSIFDTHSLSPNRSIRFYGMHHNAIRLNALCAVIIITTKKHIHQLVLPPTGWSWSVPFFGACDICRGGW